MRLTEVIRFSKKTTQRHHAGHTPVGVLIKRQEQTPKSDPTVNSCGGTANGFPVQN
jgi:hypothetical protein